MRNLGRFVGAIWHGVRSDPGEPAGRQEVRRTVEEREEEHEGRPVRVRRTTIEEVEIVDDR